MAKTLNKKKDEILFLADEKKNDLYLIRKGKVMVFVLKGTEVIPVAYLDQGEYIGELSFFDNGPRSAGILCVEDSEFIKIESSEMNEYFPSWLKIMGQSLTRKIREADELIRSKGIRKKNLESIKPLPINEQTRVFKLVDQHKVKS
jgi:CRP/FNR family cyclic AMP-dependent transcriptional regulator